MILTKDGKILTKDGQILTTDGSGASGGGSEVKLYAHNIELTVEDIYVWFTIYNLSSTPLNLDNLKTYYNIWYPASIMDDNANPDNFQGIIRISNDGTIDIYGSPYDEGNENQYIYKSNLNINQAYFADYVSLISSTTASGSGSSGKEVVEIDSSIIEWDEQGQIATFNFNNIELNNKYIVIDLTDYQQDLEMRFNNIVFDFLGSNITNSTILIKKPYIANEDLAIECVFGNAGIFLNGLNEEPNWNYYSHHIYDNDFSFSFPFTTECFLKIDFDEVGSVECKYSTQNDI